MSNVAASGGYYISAHADKIIAQPGTFTGSIGVVFGKFLTSEFWKKIGISWDSIDWGASNSYLESGLKDYDAENMKQINETLDRIYDDFISNVMHGRGMKLEEVEEHAKGRVWTGSQAFAKKLIDKFGGFYAAIDVAKQQANIPPTAKVKLVKFPHGASIWELLDQTKPRNEEEKQNSPVKPNLSLLVGGNKSLLSQIACAMKANPAVSKALLSSKVLSSSGSHVMPLSLLPFYLPSIQ